MVADTHRGDMTTTIKNMSNFKKVSICWKKNVCRPMLVAIHASFNETLGHQVTSEELARLYSLNSSVTNVLEWSL
jgi:hypothetical protein